MKTKEPRHVDTKKVQRDLTTNNRRYVYETKWLADGEEIKVIWYDGGDVRIQRYRADADIPGQQDARYSLDWVFVTVARSLICEKPGKAKTQELDLD